MNYQKVYDQIVQRAKLEDRHKKLGIYYEKHHIIPKCLNGNNSKENLILLTGREHFLCHWLLVRIYPSNKKLASAFWNMCNGRKYITQAERYVPSSRQYNEAKIAHLNAMKDLLLGVPTTEEVKKKRRCKKGMIGTWVGKSHTSVSRELMSKSALNRAKPTQATIDKRVATMKRNKELRQSIAN